ncbi:hypothetical protein Agub_g10584 [Astrephomene gubernaculifera]|uniref:Lipid desaturase domain-containing protein n=1 Tax=Astrephomene gubernaculifera TaxID=47775 RepID=A0AAD3DVS2_9CHLO|nr:hypothetical protein Agub_g10584 [Astrephomene gubernaculifera]
MALANRSSTIRARVAASHSIRAIQPLRLVIVRADPPSGGVRVTREFREGDNDVTIPGAPTVRKEADGLYIDGDAPPPRPRKDNMSKEMKARLRAEYTGFGGSENKGIAAEEAHAVSALPATPSAATVTLSFASPRTPLIIAAAAAAVTESPSLEETPALQLRPASSASEDFPMRPPGSTTFNSRTSTSATTAAAAATASSASAPASATAHSSLNPQQWVLLEEGEELMRSTPEQRAWTWTCIALLGATMQQATRQVHNAEDAVVFGAAVLLAYSLADLGTGVYHWAVDNYGDASTPLVGRQIAAFQGHHQRPWTITQRQFANNVHQVFGPACYPAAALLTLSPLMPLGWNAWSSAFLFTVCISQQLHAWSHMKKSELHPAVVALQDAGVLIGRRMHGAHHRPPFTDNYCIVSGWWNPLLDGSGVFRRMEEAIRDLTGVEPRCWHELQEDWREIERPQRRQATATAAATAAAK